MKLGNRFIEAVDQCLYLGSVDSANKFSSATLSKIGKYNYLNANIKLKLFPAHDLSVLLYRSSTWKVTTVV